MSNIREKLQLIQGKLKAPKNLNNDFSHFKYRSLESILEALKPLLMETKTILTLSDEVIFKQSRFYVVAKATFIDVEDLNSEPIIVTAEAREPDIQKGMAESMITGTASSYARKYCVNGLFLTDDNKEVDSFDTTDEKPDEKAPEKAPEKKKASAVTELQIKKLYTVAGVKGYTAAKVKATMLKKFKITTASDLTLANFNIMLKGYEGLPDKGAEHIE